MHSETIDYQDGDTQLEAYVTWDDSILGPRAGVLVAHDWTGRRDFATSKADEMAALGYVGFALDMYGKGVFGADGDVEGNSALMGALAGDRGMRTENFWWPYRSQSGNPVPFGPCPRRNRGSRIDGPQSCRAFRRSPAVWTRSQHGKAVVLRSRLARRRGLYANLWRFCFCSGVRYRT